MNPVMAVAASVILPGTLAVVIVLLLRKPLFDLLVELCGNADRARFWAVFSALFTVLSTVFGVLASLEVSDQLFDEYLWLVFMLTSIRAGVVGLLMALIAVAFVLLGAIHRFDEIDAHRRPA